MLPGFSVARGGASTGLGSLLPSGSVAVEAIGSVDPDPLFPGESELVSKAVHERRLEFARGRSCARRALRELGIAPCPILAVEREPIWPPGVLGSITHCRDYCAAAVTDGDRCQALGIDAEVLQDLEPGVAERVLLPVERSQLAALSASWASVIFSAKEATYKAMFPRTRRWLDFHDVEISLEIDAGRFTAAVEGLRLQGRFAIDTERVRCAVVI